MAERLDYVTPGEPFRPAAATWNAFVDTARTVRANRVIFGVTAPVEPSEEDVWYWGKLSTALGGGSMTTPQTCEVNVWIPDPASTADPVDFIVTTNPDLLGVTVVNRDPTAIASVGTVCKIHKGGGESPDHWSLLYLGCS